jgi:tetratricopeptide (TPR) repeat protein
VELARRWSPLWDRNVAYGLVSLKNKALDIQLETCAKCHARRYQVHEDFRPGKPFLDHYEPSLLAASLYHADGQILDEVYEYGSFLQSKMYANRVQCSDCHDPHSLKLKFAGNQLCAQCHVPAKYDTPGHHHHPAGSAGTQCVECHMPSRLYMVIDSRRDHSFRIPRPDLSVKLGTPNACNDCHNRPEESYQWASDAVRKWYGEARPDDPHWAPAIAAGRAAQPDGAEQLLGLLERTTTPVIVRATAVDLLANYPTSRSVEVRRESLRDSEPLMRLAAIRALTADAGPQLIGDLAARSSDSAAAVRVAAAARLAYLPLDSLSDRQRNALEQALIEFRSIQQHQLDHAGGHLTLGALDRHHGRIGRAIEHFQSAIKLEPYMSGPRAELASLLQQRRADPEEVRRLRREEANLLERDAKLAPDSAEILYQLGMLRYLLEELDAAQIALSSAVEKAPQNYDILMALALLLEHRYKLSGDTAQFDDSRRTLEKLHELRPADPRAKQIMLRLLATHAAWQGTTPARQN